MRPRSPEYYDRARHDVAALVPAGVSRVLDVGCGFGGLGRLLVHERGCEVYGVEQNPDAGRHLDGTYASYVIGDVNEAAVRFAAASFDCIVFADVLEHLVDPQAALQAYARLLVPGGAIVASIPNVRHISILYNLFVRGRWTYTESGLLDRTHLRFFTRTDIHELFASAGLVIERMEVNRDRLPLGKMLMAAVPLLLVRDLSVCQFRVLARRQPGADGGG